MERLTIDEIIEHCDRKTRLYEQACGVKYLETEVMYNGIKEYWEHKQVAGYLRKLKSYEDAEEQGQYGKWIPVSERLPEESLNSVIGWDTYRNRCCFVQYLGGRFVLGDDIDSVNVTAWMPLPETHRESEESE